MFRKTSAKRAIKKLAKNAPSRRQIESTVRRVVKDAQKEVSKRLSMMPIKVSLGR